MDNPNQRVNLYFYYTGHPGRHGIVNNQLRVLAARSVGINALGRMDFACFLMRGKQWPIYKAMVFIGLLDQAKMRQSSIDA
tara:strand:+ start:84 stop:326 length:243 start_codon:yes stop_codon:yes gene_type:complete